MLKRFIASLPAVLILTIGTPIALASGGPSGTYRAKISRPTGVAGVWTIKFAAGRDTDYLNGKQLASGSYTISGSTITFAQPATPKGAPATCSGAGTYRFTLSGKTLKFTKISDPCNKTRAEILAARYTKV